MTAEIGPEQPMALGEILRPRGLRGELKVRILCDDFDQLAECLERPGALAWKPDQAPRSVQVTGLRFHKGHALVQLAGVDSPEAAEALRDCLIGLRRRDLPDIGEEAWYFYELEGLEVCDPQGRPLGRIEEVEDSPAHDQLIVRGGGPDDRPFRIPLAEPFVREVDPGAGRIVVSLPPGFVESQR